MIIIEIRRKKATTNHQYIDNEQGISIFAVKTSSQKHEIY